MAASFFADDQGTAYCGPVPARSVSGMVETQLLNNNPIVPIENPFDKQDESFGGGVHIFFHWTLSFPQPVLINDVTARLFEHFENSGETDRFMSAGSSMTLTTDDTVEHLIPEFSRGFGSGGDVNDSLDTGLITVPVNLDKVLKIDAYSFVDGFANSGPGAGHTLGRVFVSSFDAMVTVPEPASITLVVIGFGLIWVGHLRRKLMQTEHAR